MRVAVLKPDHLGDLVLAAPVLAALRRCFSDLTLLCHPDTATLARHLFPGLALQSILFPHLDRTRALAADARPLNAIRNCFDLLVGLRWDASIRIHLDEAGIPYLTSGQDVLDVHVAVEQREVVAPLTGPYDLLSSYVYPGCPQPCMLPQHLRSVGLCIAAGFPLNAWPLNHWLGLAQRLGRRGIEIVLIGGPREAARLHVLADAVTAALGWRTRIVMGGSDFGGFLGKLVGSVDVVVASDSGTAHLASLVRPVLSLFGGSPWRRFAPLGRCNAVVTRELPCSPCPQFDRSLVNTCVSRECLANLLPEQVEACLDAYLAGQVTPRSRSVHGVWLACAPWEGSRSRGRLLTTVH
jgi:heptosyltransferase-2